MQGKTRGNDGSIGDGRGRGSVVAMFVLMDGGANGDGGACTRVTCLVSRHRQLEANAHEGRVGDRCIMLISKVSVCTILTTHTAL